MTRRAVMPSSADRTLSRRALLAAAGAVLLPGLARTADGADGDVRLWMPEDTQTRVLAPVITHGGARSLERVIEPRRTVTSEFLQAAPSPTGHVRAVGALPRLTQPPTAYVLTAQRSGVPAWVLFGVALQESQLLFGRETLPWPWTLDVEGRAQRFASHAAARDALQDCLRRGVTNVDCGAMQVNWRSHSGLLVSPELALDPYRNLAIGARILQSNYAATGNWPRAVGLYHTGSFSGVERRRRAVRYVAGVSARLSRHGLTLAQAAALPPAGVRHG
jgi:hypothetical protein